MYVNVIYRNEAIKHALEVRKILCKISNYFNFQHFFNQLYDRTPNLGKYFES